MKKKDFKYLSFILFFYIIFITYLTDTYRYIYGTKDIWYEIITISDIIRNNTKLIFFGPNYSINIGTNLYNYYNLITNPIIRISSLFKFIPIEIYLIITTIICLLITNILLYKLLRNKKYRREISLLSTFIFTLSSTITLSTYNDITIIHFMMFLIITLHSIEYKIKTNHNWFFIISIFLLFITNINLAIPSILVIFIYYLQLYLHNKKRINYKSFFKEIFFIITPLLLGILLSSRITLPMIVLIINKEVLLNTYHTNILYSPYGLGITSILIPSIINYISLKKERLIPSILLIISMFISIYNTLYLIVFLPLYILIITEFIKNIINHKINYKKLFIITIIISLIIYINTKKIIYLIDLYTILIIIYIYNKNNKKNYIYIPIFIIALINCYINNLNNNLILKEDYYNNKEEVTNIINTLTTNDKNIYRINNELPYEIYNTNYLRLNTNNKIDNILNNKYIITKKEYIEYKLLKEINNIKVYQNTKTLPIIYTSVNNMNYEDYYSLENIYQQESEINTIITEDFSNNQYISYIQDTNLTMQDIFNTDIYSIDTLEPIKIDYEIPYKFQNKIIIIEIESNKEIIINNIKSNKEFIIDSPTTKLEIILEKGKYKIENIKIYTLDINKIKPTTNLIKKVNIDTISNNIIECHTTSEANSYLVIRLPYDKYYKIYLNEKEEPYEIVNNKYIGVRLNKGNYNIRIVYYGPLYTLSILTTMFSFIIYFIITIIELERKI